MAYIDVQKGIPGIRSLFQFSPETGGPLCDLAETLLRGPSTLSSGERELIAAYTSNRNECMFCMNSHAAAARSYYDEDKHVVDELLKEKTAGSFPPRIRALLYIAGKIQENGKKVLPEDIEAAKAEGADDTDIHDTVLIAASFSMFNRYVDGLASFTPPNESDYTEMGKRMSTIGYHL